MKYRTAGKPAARFLFYKTELYVKLINIQLIFHNSIDFCRTIPYVYFARQK